LSTCVIPDNSQRSPVKCRPSPARAWHTSCSQGSRHRARPSWRVVAPVLKYWACERDFQLHGRLPGSCGVNRLLDTEDRQWLDGRVVSDVQGFIKTVSELSPDDLSAAHWPLGRAPHLLETSVPGVFAAGDVRAGNIKRVASAVGEGSISVSFVHQVLHE
jgi:hypothetical protein